MPIKYRRDLPEWRQLELAQLVAIAGTPVAARKKYPIREMPDVVAAVARRFGFPDMPQMKANIAAEQQRLKNEDVPMPEEPAEPVTPEPEPEPAEEPGPEPEPAAEDPGEPITRDDVLSDSQAIIDLLMRAEKLHASDDGVDGALATALDHLVFLASEVERAEKHAARAALQQAQDDVTAILAQIAQLNAQLAEAEAAVTAAQQALA